MCLPATSWHYTCVINLLAPPGAFLLQLSITIPSSGKLFLFVAYLEVSGKWQSFLDGQLADNCYSGISLSHGTVFFSLKNFLDILPVFIVASSINRPNFLWGHGSNNWNNWIRKILMYLAYLYFFSFQILNNLLLVGNWQFKFSQYSYCPFQTSINLKECHVHDLLFSYICH